ncbi:hypothetical protein BDP27DRAFT_1328134 [Rhodocollybia butyracea]|uniref:F-box domain-containing protein n=1 Tax=Rhodocollybia butyracea TaxID=206335 RepID=A0A9P5PSR2_9AGAR|nr:hypothetical protein BDP27DRAFT_1328134 [Rhodocollybia butyracea]
MVTLMDLPEELLCSICEKAEPSTLLSLAASCKRLNRIAGSQYLLFISHDSQRPLLFVADKETSIAMSFNTLRNIMSIAGSTSRVTTVTFQFSFSAEKTLQQIRLATFLGVKSDIPYFSPSFNMFPSFNGEFGRLLWEAHRLRCSSLTLFGIIPFTQDCFKFSPLINTSLSYFAVDAAFLLSRAQRGWLIELLNASKAISHIRAYGSEGWTHILPKLRLPSITGISFIGKAVGTPSAIEILAEFCNRHQNLCRIDCGSYQSKTSLTPCQYSLSQMQELRASVSQLLYFVSDPSRLCNLKVIEIQCPELDLHLPSMSSHSTTGLWHLFSCLCDRPSIQELIVPANFPGLEKDVLSKTQSSLESRFIYLTKLQFREFHSLAEPARQDFLKWSSKVFPSLKSLELAYSMSMGWDAEQTSCFARTVAKELPLIENLTLEYRTRRVREWIEDPLESTKA